MLLIGRRRGRRPEGRGRARGLVEATVEKAAAADAVVVLVDHDAFDLPALVAAAPFVLDCRHVAEGPNVEHL